MHIHSAISVARKPPNAAGTMVPLKQKSPMNLTIRWVSLYWRKENPSVRSICFAFTEFKEVECYKKHQHEYHRHQYEYHRHQHRMLNACIRVECLGVHMEWKLAVIAFCSVVVWQPKFKIYYLQSWNYMLRNSKWDVKFILITLYLILKIRDKLLGASSKLSLGVKFMLVT